MSHPRDGAPLVSRRSVVAGGVLSACVLAGGGLLARSQGGPSYDTLDDRALYSLTIAFSAEDARMFAAEPDDLIAGTRVSASAADAVELLTREDQWLDSLASWTREAPFADQVRSAYQDMFVLTEGLPATVAGWNPKWRHIWPRDTAHVAVAFAAAGDLPRAFAQLDYLAQAPRTRHGWFEARYGLETGLAPDSRAPQFDGLGWSTWALGWIYGRLEPDQRDEYAQRYGTFAASLAATVLESLDEGRPPISPDYWEVSEWRVTLGTAAPALAGLQHLQPLLEDLGDEMPAAGGLGGSGAPGGADGSSGLSTPSRSGEGDEGLRVAGTAALAQASRTAQTELADYIRRKFADRGFPRHAGGRRADSAVAFMLPPYVLTWHDTEHVRSELHRTTELLTQPAGGVKPGELWKNDGISWTPETAYIAMANAHSPHEADRSRAAAQLEWLGAHRTSAGSYPEKVLASGEPVAVAPLAWTAACVALTAHALAHG